MCACTIMRFPKTIRPSLVGEAKLSLPDPFSTSCSSYDDLQYSIPVESPPMQNFKLKGTRTLDLGGLPTAAFGGL